MPQHICAITANHAVGQSSDSAAMAWVELGQEGQQRASMVRACNVNLVTASLHALVQAVNRLAYLTVSDGERTP